MNVLLYLADHCEDVEALGTRALLVRSGLNVKTVSTSPNRQITTAFGLQVKVNLTLDEVDVESYEAMIIPGGKYVAMTVDDSAPLQSLIQAFDQKQKGLYAICAGPRFLGRLNLLKDASYTAYPGSEKDIAGTYLPEEKVVHDGRFITARSAGAVYEFARKIVSVLQGETQAKWLEDNILL